MPQNCKRKLTHNPEFCHKPNKIGCEKDAFISLEQFQKTPLPCQCCRTPLLPVNDLSLPLQQLGIYRIVCPNCP